MHTGTFLKKLIFFNMFFSLLISYRLLPICYSFLWLIRISYLELRWKMRQSLALLYMLGRSWFRKLILTNCKAFSDCNSSSLNFTFINGFVCFYFCIISFLFVFAPGNFLTVISLCLLLRMRMSLSSLSISDSIQTR